MVTYLFFDTNVHDTRLDSQPTTTQVGPGPQGRRGRIGQELLGAASLCRLQWWWWGPRPLESGSTGGAGGDGECWPPEGSGQGLSAPQAPAALGTPGSQPQAQVLRSNLCTSRSIGRGRWREGSGFLVLTSWRKGGSGGSSEKRHRAGLQLESLSVPVLTPSVPPSSKWARPPERHCRPHTHTQARRDTRLPQS